MRLFHILERAAWECVRSEPAYRPASLAAEGFIHLSTARQWPGVVDRWFAGKRDLILLSIDPGRLRAEVRYERVGGDEFPHLYGPLEIDAVVDALELPEDVDARAALAMRLASP